MTMGELVTAAKARIQMAWGHADPGTRGGDWYTAGDGQARRHSCVREEVGHCASGPLPCKQRTANPGLRFWVYPGSSYMYTIPVHPLQIFKTK